MSGKTVATKARETAELLSLLGIRGGDVLTLSISKHCQSALHVREDAFKLAHKKLGEPKISIEPYRGDTVFFRFKAKQIEWSCCLIHEKAKPWIDAMQRAVNNKMLAPVIARLESKPTIARLEHNA